MNRIFVFPGLWNTTGFIKVMVKNIIKIYIKNILKRVVIHETEAVFLEFGITMLAPKLKCYFFLLALEENVKASQEENAMVA